MHLASWYLEKEQRHRGKEATQGDKLEEIQQMKEIIQQMLGEELLIMTAKILQTMTWDGMILNQASKFCP